MTVAFIVIIIGLWFIGVDISSELFNISVLLGFGMFLAVTGLSIAGIVGVLP